VSLLPSRRWPRQLWWLGFGVTVIAIGVLLWTHFAGPRPQGLKKIAIPGCSDPAYLADVQGIVQFSGLKQVRAVSEISATDAHRSCRLIAQDVNGKDVALRSSLRHVGADMQLSVEFE
jgi:hypothetical protein